MWRLPTLYPRSTLPTLSILTPVHSNTAVFLPDAARSIERLRLPKQWNVEWVVQEDADEPTLAKTVARLGGEYGANPRRAGASATRNLALLRAKGDFVFSLDADDQLVPDGLPALIERLDGDFGWVCGGHIDHMGHPTDDWNPQSSRVWSRGELLAHGTRNWGFHPNNLLVRTSALWEIGGWPALTGLEDKMLVLALNIAHSGASTKIATVQYRRHGKQTIADPAFLEHLTTYHEFASRFALANLTQTFPSRFTPPNQTAA